MCHRTYIAQVRANLYDLAHQMLATSIAQRQSVPPAVLKVMGSIPVRDSEFFFFLSEKDFDIIYLFIHSFIHSFIYSLFIHLFIY